MDMSFGTKQYSNFRIETYLQCKRKYYYIYMARQVKDDDIQRPYLTDGQFCHDVLRHYRAELKKQPPEANRRKIMSWCFDLYSKMYDPRTMNLAMCKDMLIEYFLRYQHEPRGNSIELEEKFNIPFGNINLIGTIDRVDQIGENEYNILDYKTTNKPHYLDSSLQGAIYYAAGKHKYGVDAKINVGYVLLKFESEIKWIDEAVLQAKVHDIIPACQKIIGEKNWRERTVSPLCDYCDYASSCFPNTWKPELLV